MTNVFTFIEAGLEEFSDDGGIYDTKIKEVCLWLNKFLNKLDDDEDDYQRHLNVNGSKVCNVSYCPWHYTPG